MYPPPFVPEYNYMPPGYPIPNLMRPNEIPLQNIYNIPNTFFFYETNIKKINVCWIQLVI